jgi:prepilin-type N-terminal cleavage/methylation domain-containing protein
MRTPSVRRGFSLIELLVVLAIASVVSGVAVFSFINLSKSMRLESGARKLDQALINTRQQAIASRSGRRVAINLVNHSFWIEARRVETKDWQPENVRTLTDREGLPKGVIVADISGYTARDIRGNVKNWYIEFDSRGSAKSYPSDPPPLVNPVIPRSMPFHERNNAAIHLMLEDSLIPLSENENRAYDLTDRQLVEYINSITAIDEDGDGIDDGGEDNGFPVNTLVSAEARRQVATVFLLALTGRTNVFEYGYEIPWSDVDVPVR